MALVNTGSPRQPSDFPQYWNVFATVLDDMLKAQVPEFRLGHLDDRPDPETGFKIHRQKVARLQHSLVMPIFPTLTPEEIDQVVRAFDLSLDQKIRLHAAVLATAVQAILSGRIGAENARLAGWQVLPIVEDQLRLHWDEDEGLGAARDPLWLPDIDIDAFTAEYGVALAEIDRGTLHLTLARRTLARREQQATAYAAKRSFEVAVQLLDAINEEVDPLLKEIGAYWQEEARQGLNAAQKLLA